MLPAAAACLLPAADALKRTPYHLRLAGHVCHACFRPLAQPVENREGFNPCLPRYCGACKGAEATEGARQLDTKLAALRIRLADIAKEHPVRCSGQMAASWGCSSSQLLLGVVPAPICCLGLLQGMCWLGSVAGWLLGAAAGEGMLLRIPPGRHWQGAPAGSTRTHAVCLHWMTSPSNAGWLLFVAASGLAFGCCGAAAGRAAACVARGWLLCRLTPTRSRETQPKQSRWSTSCCTRWSC